jgi:hypothetical protein
MENKIATIEKLIEKAETYSKTSLALCKNEAIYKLADISSNLFVKLVITVVVILFLLFINIGLALFIGDYLEAPFLGFFVIGLGYFLIAILLYIFRESWIITPVSNFIIRKMNTKNIL